jgi:hypothetical protein
VHRSALSACLAYGALREKFSRLIAQEGGKPIADATVEVNRAIDGVRTTGFPATVA